MEHQESLLQQANKEFEELANSYPIEEREEKVKKLYEACYKQYLDALTESLSLQYDKATNYFNIIFGVGYIGLFTAWGNLKDTLSKQQNNIIGISLTVSIGVLMLWEVIKMISTYYQLNKSQKILNEPKEKTINSTKAHASDIKREKLNRDSFWLPIIWSITITLGVIASVTLVYGLFRGL